MVSKKFRRQLRQEAERWRSQGLIDEAFYAELSRFYRFDELPASEGNPLKTISIGLGIIIVGAIAIALVSSNWQFWSQELKLILLVSSFAIANTIGFYFWQRPTSSWHDRLGKGLLLLGSLLFGANLALMSEIFHQNVTIYQLFLIWGLGVLVMAYSLRLTSLGILAAILTFIGYGTGIVTLFPHSEDSWFGLAVEHMPLLISAIGIPLAYWCRSRLLFGLGTIAIVLSLEANLIVFWAKFINFSPFTRGMMLAIAVSLPPALLWAYRDFFLKTPNDIDKPNPLPSFDAISRNIGLVFIGVLFYIFSFHWVWNPFNYRTGSPIVWRDWLRLIDIGWLGGLTIWAWWRLGCRTGENRRWRLDRNSTAIGIAILTTAAIVWWHISVRAISAIATVIFNLFFFIFAIELLRQGLSTGKRRHFWLGIFLIAVQFISRILEYVTDVSIGAIALGLCGLGIIAAGLWFERHLRTVSALRSKTNDE